MSGVSVVRVAVAWRHQPHSDSDINTRVLIESSNCKRDYPRQRLRIGIRKPRPAVGVRSAPRRDE